MRRLLQIALLIFLVSCVGKEEKGLTAEGISVSDFRDKALHFDKPVSRVACLIESALSGMYMLGQEDRLVAVPAAVYEKELLKYYGKLDKRISQRTLPAPGNWDYISLEQVIETKPELVILWASQTEAINSLEQLGIPVYAVMLHSFEDVYKEMRDFGLLFDAAARADRLVAYTINSLEKIKANPSKESVYFMWAQGINETSGTNSTVNELLEASGTVNACELKQEHVTISIEKLHEWNPGIVVMWHNAKLDPSDILSHPLLSDLSAVRNGRVYELPEVFACDFWTLKLQFPVRLIANYASGEPLSQQDQNNMLSEMYETLYGKNLLE